MDRGDEPVRDPEDGRRLRAQAHRVHAESVIGAALLTALALLAAVGFGR